MSKNTFSRRKFVQTASVGLASFAVPYCTPSQAASKKMYKIGLSMYSLRFLFQDGTLDALDYPAFAKDTFGIELLDVWDGGFPKDRKEDPAFYKELKERADKAGTEIFLLMAGAVDADRASSVASVRPASVRPVSVPRLVIAV